LAGCHTLDTRGKLVEPSGWSHPLHHGALTIEQSADFQLKPAVSDEERAHALRLRHIVFVDEQNVPLDMEIDQHDSTDAHHYLGWLNGEPVAAARIVVFPNYVKLQRIALLEKHRGKGLGGTMLQHLIGFAKTLAPDLPVALDAQVQARGLYKKHGFEAQGSVFDDAGIDHIHMRLH